MKRRTTTGRRVAPRTNGANERNDFFWGARKDERVAIGADLTNAIGIATLAALFATSIAARLAVLAEVDCNL